MLDENSLQNPAENISMVSWHVVQNPAEKISIVSGHGVEVLCPEACLSVCQTVRLSVRNAITQELL